jgi:hypothetical protein
MRAWGAFICELVYSLTKVMGWPGPEGAGTIAFIEIARDDCGTVSFADPAPFD